MLEKYLELKQTDDSKKLSRKLALESIDREFGDTESPLKEEREKLFAWMQENNEERYVDGENGLIKLRESKPKHIIKDERALIEFLMQGLYHEALEIKKSKVNLLKEQNAIPDELVETVTELELQILRSLDDEKDY